MRLRNVIACLSLATLVSFVAFAQAKLTSPKEHFGFNIGDDYQLANYTQYEAYLKKLDAESDRLKVVEMGKSAEGRTIYLAIVTTPENHKNLAKYRDISRRLTLVEGLSDEEAKRLAKEGKTIVWIDGGLHANEVLGAQQLIETLWMLVSGNDEEVMRFLNDDIALLCLVNPDGMELVSNWYMRESDPLKRSTGNLPRLYQKYIGHDNNRDFYMSAQPESEAINRVFYHEWFPQIVYNHHQTGPLGTVMFAPPFRDPFNYNFDPLIPLGIDLVGAAMHSRFAAEGKPGVTMRTGASYSTWWNGGLRTTVYFHNMIGLLTETIGNPTPMDIPLVLGKQLPKADLSSPIAPQKWHFRQSIEYSLTANRAVLDVASRYRDTFLYRQYQMGKNAIARGSRDHWTVSPKVIAEQQANAARDAARERRNETADGPRFERAIGSERAVEKKYFEAMRTPERRDPRGFIIPSDQSDFLTAIKFANALIKTGVTIHRASANFSVNNKNYPAGSLVVKTAQAFRPHVLDMFEPQDHPNDFAYPGGPPLPPYDSAGWTLAMQMGVQFDRVPDGFDGPFEKVSGFIKPAAGKFLATVNGATPVGFVTSHAVNDSFIATAKLLASGEEVFWLKDAQGGRAAGTIFIPVKTGTAAKLQKLSSELGVSFEGIANKPSGEMFKLKQPRIALFDRYGGSMPSGWTRWLLEQFQIPFTVIYPPTLDAGDLKSKFDVIIFVTGSIPASGGRSAGGFGGGDEASSGGGERNANIPDEFKGWLGNVTTNKTVPQLKAFLEAGGALLAIGSSTAMGYHANLPIANALIERQPDGSERPLARDKFYIPGSLLQVSVNNAHPLAYGLPDKVTMYYDNSPAFRLKPDAALKGVNAVAWFDSDKPLRSGWAWGQKYLQDSAAVIEANVGKGKLFLYGPEIAFRAQPHGTFKFLFNGIYYGTAEVVK